MIPTKMIELELPTKIDLEPRERLQRSMLQHLLMEKEITMLDALTLLSEDDQRWLVNNVLQTAQENLFIACHISDEIWSKKCWQRYSNQLGHLFAWFHREADLSYHGQLLAMLRTLTRRYSPLQFTAEQIELIQRLTLRLHEDKLNQDDILTGMCNLEESGLSTLLDLSPVADQLFVSYVDELGRS